MNLSIVSLLTVIFVLTACTTVVPPEDTIDSGASDTQASIESVRQVLITDTAVDGYLQDLCLSNQKDCIENLFFTGLDQGNYYEVAFLPQNADEIQKANPLNYSTEVYRFYKDTNKVMRLSPFAGVFENVDGVQAPLTDDVSGANHEYTLSFDDVNTTKTFTVYHEAEQSDTISFINDGFTQLSVDIVLPAGQTGANLRLSQIIMPDGSMDGPFGLDTTYDLTQNGGYQLILSENMMAGDPWSGTAQVTVAVAK
ncbi:MAG: hypothetical protein H6766_03185 [Candidatus Peribacteria bacterium]|nr:MAG: hypothetical protein H6766_03185 [Candidatus Peribacteria bacterium]